MDLGKRFSELTGINVTGIIHSVVEAVADRSSYSLEESRHAPQKLKDSVAARYSFQASHNASSDKTKTSPSRPSSPPSPPRLDTPYQTAEKHSTATMASTTGFRVADVDDTAGFMAAARALKLTSTYGPRPTPVEDTSSDQGASGQEGTPGSVVENDFFSAPTYNQTAWESQPQTQAQVQEQEAFDEKSASTDSSVGDFGVESNLVGVSVKESDVTPKNDNIAASNIAFSFGSGAHTPETESSRPEAEQNREHLTTFKTWGTPAIRDKPASQVRRAIIKGLPHTWSTPDKVLSLVHGGLVESISITASGNAHVLFCDHNACKAFFDKYPNGIDLDKERKYTVFVDMGQEVDVISSQLSFNLSVGSTRVIRAVGVNMDVTMTQMFKFASANNRKLEKIVDTYVPGYPRTVNFRFCSIEDAVRFRAALIRDEDWEHCNVQYGTDPCELATGYHAD